MKFQWTENKYYLETGAEMYGKEFFARVSNKNHLKEYGQKSFSTTVYNHNGDIYFEKLDEYKTEDEAINIAEEYLEYAILDFTRKIC